VRSREAESPFVSSEVETHLRAKSRSLGCGKAAVYPERRRRRRRGARQCPSTSCRRHEVHLERPPWQAVEELGANGSI